MYHILKKYFYFIVVILVGIILYFSYMNSRVHRESFVGVDDNPNNFIEPRIYPNIISQDEANYILEKSKDLPSLPI